MTQETRIVFDLSDIVNIRLVCANPECGGETMCPLGSKYQIPEKCPYCPERWITNGSDTPEAKLVKAMRHVQLQSNPPVELRFEMRLPGNREERPPA